MAERHDRGRESVEKLQHELATALAKQSNRFVVVIDDIDRLSPDEALAVFRLVKSVGRLPNIIYVLAFDRVLAERIVAERFPSEGPHYLEKIVQASFELPEPLESDLHQLLLGNIYEIAGVPEERLIVHVANMFHEVLARKPAPPVMWSGSLTPFRSLGPPWSVKWTSATSLRWKHIAYSAQQSTTRSGLTKRSSRVPPR